jgi:small subunit ribosomal protein S16
MLSIRLSRVGKKKQPIYRVIVLDNRKDPWGDYIENLGTYNPLKTPKEVILKADRVKYWLSVGAQPSETVHNILVDEKIIDKPKVRATSPKKKAKEEGTEQAKPAEKKEEAPAAEKKPTADTENKEESK